MATSAEPTFQGCEWDSTLPPLGIVRTYLGRRAVLGTFRIDGGSEA